MAWASHRVKYSTRLASTRLAAVRRCYGSSAAGSLHASGAGDRQVGLLLTSLGGATLLYAHCREKRGPHADAARAALPCRRALQCETPGAEQQPAGGRHLRVAFVGNSYIYFNDVPRLLQALHHGPDKVETGDCLLGGSSWKSLLKKGNGMEKKFQSPNALLPDGSYDIGAPTVQALLSDENGWDFCVMGTYSQEAARLELRQNGFEALDVLAPMLDKAGAKAVLLVTPAYRAAVKRSETIGDWATFAWRQSEGYGLYASHLAARCDKARLPRLADANRAFQLVHGERPELWKELFFDDDFHPSALGSFLQACVIYCAIHGEAPHLSPDVLADPAKLWARARRMLPPPCVGRMPSADELLYLRSVAMRASHADALAGVERQ
eukprot:TRINITY_DN71262_c0_g1_i1.p1 TRINITY_DN71262_c0_g1~~TRINITY_DN71262_c0_g1_i1.p1  ORF type:complete len:399 (-),score=73.45 TRINITY_DN71262_c0_g1_i1:480-1622(-)